MRFHGARSIIYDNEARSLLINISGRFSPTLVSETRNPRKTLYRPVDRDRPSNTPARGLVNHDPRRLDRGPVIATI